MKKYTLIIIMLYSYLTVWAKYDYNLIYKIITTNTGFDIFWENSTEPNISGYIIYKWQTFEKSSIVIEKITGGNNTQHAYSIKTDPYINTKYFVTWFKDTEAGIITGAVNNVNLQNESVFKSAPKLEVKTTACKGIEITIDTVDYVLDSLNITLETSTSDFTIYKLGKSNKYNIEIETIKNIPGIKLNNNLYKFSIQFFDKELARDKSIFDSARLVYQTPPTSITINSLSNNNNNITISALPNIINATQVYDIQKSVGDINTFKTVGKFIPKNTDTHITFNDIINNTDPTIYYKIQYTNSCNVNQTVISQTVATLKLDAVLNENTINLNWAEPLTFNNYKYKLFRFDATNTLLIDSTLSQYSHNIEEFKNKGLSYNICYKVEATEYVNNQYTNRWSNQACIQIKIKLNMPDGFTPNADGVNDKFNAQLSFIPQSYFMAIFNRNGVKIFETTNVNDGWNGTDAFGKAPEGVYIYYVRIKNTDGTNVEQKGTFTLYNN